MADTYRDPAASIEARVEDLLARMTVAEKCAQLGCVWSTHLVADDRFSLERARELLRHGTGHITRIGASTGLRPAQSAAFANAIQRFLVEETRLGIPAIIHEESTAGFTARDATQFPQAIGLASTWNPTLIEEVARVIRAQMLAVGARQTLAPVLDIARDPRWGRTEETYGEDPYLASRLGVAYVRGIQGDDLRTGVVATGKHFLAYGAPEGGLNHAPAHVGARELREVYCRPFEAAIREAGLASVMNAYNEVDGLPCGGSVAILDGLLRGALGFEGVVVADYFTTRLLMTFHRVAADKGEAARLALGAGLDVELPALECYGAPLEGAVESGAVPLAWLDRSVRRVLRMKLGLGLFEQPLVDAARAAAVYQTPAQRQLAREVSRQSIVLLKNDGGLLPLPADIDRVAVIGPTADDVRLLQGDYSYPAHLEIIYKRAGAPPPGDIAPRTDVAAFKAGPYFVPMLTPLAGIRAAVSAATQVTYSPGCAIAGDDTSGIAAAVQAARAAAVAVVCVGGKSGLMPDCTSGEFRDASDLGLTGVQQQLVDAVLDSGTPTVVVLVNGRVFALPAIAARAAALVEAWLPGEEGGGALADVLFGVVAPSGRLPITLPRTVGQVPIYYGHKSGGGRSQMLGDYSDGPTTPLFPFGHGLTYTEFGYADLAVTPESAAADAPIEIACTVRNAGRRAAVEVVQLYVRDQVASVTRPVQQLVGFARIELAPGAARRVTFSLDPSQLAFFDAGMRFVVEPGEFEVMVGASSADIRLRGRFAVVGGARELRTADLRPTAVRVEVC
ncbi:MAG: glycoside hydrolase family 3 N-terminal domain-containing protein [Deltaproteobacteria bacterium]|nr:glycoside hydrolase family 3 N-terminal domain-containing protein [Deltaproteobacteria bacterium]